MHKEIKTFIYNIRYPILLLAIMWLVRLADSIWSLGFSVLGINPRVLTGLPGILTTPFIHGSWSHLASNSLPLFTLSTILVLFYKKVASQVFIFIILGSGILIWLFARPSYHIGASGLVYGLISFIFFTGLFKKNAKSVVLSLIVLTLYAGSVESLFPNVAKNISWESHLFGAIVGLVTAFVFRNVVEADEEQYHQPPSWANDNTEKQYFFSRDVFEKTKLQRYYEYLEAERQRMLQAAQNQNNTLPQ
ncbi:MAG: rhomboid family intramembrane serine protease [Saprospiraceae bacterium]|jgi:membrane associated rhomboid family serine protease